MEISYALVSQITRPNRDLAHFRLLNLILGPSEITIFNAEVLSAIDGPGSACTKAVWYDILSPDVLINTTRDKQLHDARRKIWNHGFSTKGLP